MAGYYDGVMKIIGSGPAPALPASVQALAGGQPQPQAPAQPQTPAQPQSETRERDRGERGHDKGGHANPRRDAMKAWKAGRPDREMDPAAFQAWLGQMPSLLDMGLGARGIPPTMIGARGFATNPGERVAPVPMGQPVAGPTMPLGIGSKMLAAPPGFGGGAGGFTPSWLQNTTRGF